jgi:hypothetical protein
LTIFDVIHLALRMPWPRYALPYRVCARRGVISNLCLVLAGEALNGMLRVAEGVPCHLFRAGQDAFPLYLGA